MVLDKAEAATTVELWYDCPAAEMPLTRIWPSTRPGDEGKQKTPKLSEVAR